MKLGKEAGDRIALALITYKAINGVVFNK